MIYGVNISEFSYSNNYQEYDFVLNKEIIELECKHIMSISDTTRELYDRAIKAAHECFIFGSHRNGTIESEKDVIFNMTKSTFSRPMRVVITKDNRIWADNTHSAIAYILRYGKYIKLNNVPMYIVDTRYELSKIISINGSVLNSVEDIQNAIACSERLNKRICKGYRPLNLNWRIKDLMLQLELSI